MSSEVMMMPKQTIEIDVPEGREAVSVSQEGPNPSYVDIRVHLRPIPIILAKFPKGIIVALSNKKDFIEFKAVEARSIEWDENLGVYIYMGEQFKFCRIPTTYRYATHDFDGRDIEGITWGATANDFYFYFICVNYGYCMPHELEVDDNV
jgi:hypothetical protein